MDLLETALKRAFINKLVPSDTLNPKFIINNPKKKDFLLTTVQSDLDKCQSFVISVAFITQSGLNAIKVQLADLEQRGIKGRILTSTYLGFNQPEVFESLMRIPNVDIRISEKEGFHAKGYLFDMGDYQSFIIGSSNLTMAALKQNYEWNVKLTSYDNGEMITTIQEHLENEWRTAVPLTDDWLTKFKKSYRPIINSQIIRQEKTILAEEDSVYITPNKMQKAALSSLKDLRETGASKGLVISATGTGKTYLAALDVASYEPKRMLFIVHREQILKKAMASFKKVIGGKDSDYGILSGNSKETEAKYLFATIQTISKDNYQELLGKSAFDYILIDEVHKAGAETYQKVIEYFTPDFLLGMTATPERTDGFNVFELFDYNVAYEIRLQEALEEDILCPFHYFGVTDYEKNGLLINETSELKYLVNQERIDFLINKIDYYGCSGNQAKGLVFCSRKEEAKELSLLFNQRGIPSAYLSGDDKLDVRESEIEKLEQGQIHYIFTVDIFNEGIDIPKVNQVIMLRNTESSIIFIQQLGRGLRKDESKDFVTVIDFIGNYRNNYMIPMALSGDHSRNKNNLRRDTIDASYISGLSAINFEKIAKERIFSSIDQAKLDSMVELKRNFYLLKNRLNRVPYLLDFEEAGSVDPLLIAGKTKTFYQFLEKLGETEGNISDEESQALRFVSSELLSGIRPHELLILANFLKTKKEELTIKQIEALFVEQSIFYTQDILESSLKVLDLSFYESGLRKRYLPSQMFTFESEKLVITNNLKTYLENPYFEKLLGDSVLTGLKKAENYEITQPLNLYKKYRRKDALRQLNMIFNQNEQGIGGYTSSNNHFTIFVTLDKGKDFKASLMAYEDEFLDERTFRWFTKAPRTLNSKEVKDIRDLDDLHIHLFIKRKYTNKDNETDFYYMGEMKPIKESITQKQKATSDGKMKNVVEIDFKLGTAVESNMYEFLTKVVEEKRS
ncbi:DUF3427 domain-containing protein [Vagococcus hydrophili]|uniref:DEAD/DEAH box helicase n=1 Tax=Vagococcus hydrophili TaxID=2714947 RepID=A0A6G8ASS6_9ENTE|nr:DEAD/DEAH box helicase [Vagococcus hydrophili]QIL48056.1 DEAD/DEAH box helicase [Vagococcus hydrophili]